MIDQSGIVSLQTYVIKQSSFQKESLLEVSVVGSPLATSIKDVTYPSIPVLPGRTVTKKQVIVFEYIENPNAPGGIEWRMNGKAHNKESMFTFEGDVVLFELQNRFSPEHPFHLHGQFFEVVSRNDTFAKEPGLKDTVLVRIQECVVIRAYMDNPALWMTHCHNLEHIEAGIMGHIVAKPKPE